MRSPTVSLGGTFATGLHARFGRAGFAPAGFHQVVNVRPQLSVRRDWLRLALNRLAELVSAIPDDANVVFSFDGSVFSIRCDGELIALAAQGRPWTVDIGVRAGELRRLPKRLMRENIEISIWESRISIANRTYAGVLKGFSPIDPSEVQ